MKTNSLKSDLQPTIARIPVGMLLAWIATVASIYFTLIFYPGVLYTDSYGRWSIALNPFSANPRPDLSFAPAVVMAMTYKLTQNYASFTVLQSFLFFLSSFLILRRMAGLPNYWSLLLTLPLLFFPLWPSYSTFHESGVGAVVGLNFALVLATSERRRTPLWLGILSHLGLFLALVVLFGFRLNAVTVVPVFVYLFCRRARRVAAATKCTVLAAALLTAKYMPQALGTPEADNSAMGFVWEAVQVLKRVHKQEYDRYFDYLGNVQEAMVQVEGDMWASLYGANGLNPHLLRGADHSRRAKADYLRLAWKEPREFIANKLHVADRVLGISSTLGFWEFDEDRGGEIEKYGARKTQLRHDAFELTVATMRRWPFLSRPWIVFAIGLAAFLIDRFWMRPRARLSGVVYACAVFYYGAFLITTQSYEFRYFFPSLLLVFVLVLAVAARGLHRAVALIGPALKD